MKKKIISVLSALVILTVIGLWITYYFSIDNKEVVNNKKTNVDDEIVEESKDLFGKYYKEADEMTSKMLLEEKVGQLFLVRYNQDLADTYINNYNVGGFVLFARDFQYHSADSIKKEIANHQEISKIKLAMAVDEEGGYVTRVSKYPAFRSSKFLSPKEYYQDGGYELLESIENEKASILKNIGLNLNLAPVADISVNPNDFIYSRSFGHNAEETSTFIKNMVSYANNNNISSCLKHFPGYGNNVDTHTGIAIDNREYANFVNNDYLPFKAGIDEKVPFILVSHNIVNSMDSEYPSSLSYKVVTGELRDKLNFSGIIITDDLDMDAVKSYAEGGNAATLAINAGVDMIITSDFVNMYNEIIDGVNNKKIDIEKVDMAAKRIIAWKLAYKIM